MMQEIICHLSTMQPLRTALECRSSIRLMPGCGLSETRTV